MKKYWQRCLLAVILVMILMLIGCGKEKDDTSNVEVYETLEETDYEFLVFYDPAAEMMLQSFKENHPDIKINGVEFDHWKSGDEGTLLKYTIEKYGPPDLILGRLWRFEEDLEDLPSCYEKGYIEDLDSYYAEDVSLDQTQYFPGTFEVFRDKDHLYALPLGISVDFMLTTDSKYDNSSFSFLETGYTGRELMEVLKEEAEKNSGSGEFFCTELVSGMKILNQLGGITQTDEGIQVDEALFQQVYEFEYLNNDQWSKARDKWEESGIQYTNDNGFIEQPALEPRMYENQFMLNFWGDMDAAAIALSYATASNLYHLEEGTKAIYIPNKDDGNSYKAAVKVYGAIGAESRRKELAYELLRMIMDEKITYFGFLDDSNLGWFDLGNSYNLYPVNKENAIGLLEEFENRNTQLFYGQLGSGRFLQMLDIVEVSETERVKHENMLNGIDGLYYWDQNVERADLIINSYHSAEITGYKACYDEVVEALNSDLWEESSIEDEGEESSEEIDRTDETQDSLIIAESDESTEAEKLKEKIRNVDIGNTFFLGETEQDNNLENGAEPLEWIMLEKAEDKAFVISKKVIEWLTFSKYDDTEVHEYGENGVVISASGSPNDFTWDIELNQQRIWLTNELYTNGFTESEKELILLTYEEANEWREGEFEDYLYIPSKEDVEEYMPDAHLRQAEMTAYVAAKAKLEEDEYIRWSLRTVAASYKSTMQIMENGEIGSWYTNVPNGVRPVMWLDIS